MKCMSRHLNWTALFGTIFCCIFGWSIIKLVLSVSGMAYIPYPGTPYYPPKTATDYPDFTGRLIIDLAIVASLPIYAWILRKKKKSYFYLLFIVSPLLMSFSATGSALALIVIPIWLIGFFILLALKNESTEV
jgi:hypothetical protein